MLRERVSTTSIGAGGRCNPDLRDDTADFPPDPRPIERKQTGGHHAESQTAKNISHPETPERGAAPLDSNAGRDRNPTERPIHNHNLFSGLEAEELTGAGAVFGEAVVFIVLTGDLHVLSASTRFLRHFDLPSSNVRGLFLGELQGGVWMVPELLAAIETVVQGGSSEAEAFVAGEFPSVGHRALQVTVLNAPLPPKAALLCVTDVTELEQTKADLGRSKSELIRLSATLINSQEAERSRVARELHDELNQKLAMLAVNADQIKATVRDAESRKSLDSLRKSIEDLMSDVRTLAHQLHPSILDHLGLDVALRSYCEDFSARGGIQVKYSSSGVSGTVSPEVELCLYRVCQESLRNIAKHSGALRAEVRLERTAEEITLSVRDWGSGFDIEEARRTGGIGLVSIRERARLVGGTATVESHPGQGTKISVRVPFAKGAKNE